MSAQVSKRVCLGKVDWRVFLDGLAALPSTDRLAFEEQRRLDEDLATCFFALRQTLSLVESCAALEATNAKAGLEAQRLKGLKKSAGKTLTRQTQSAASPSLLQEKLRQTVLELHALIRRVRKPHFALFVLLHICSLCFAKSPRREEKLTRQGTQDLPDSSAVESSKVPKEEDCHSKPAFVVPPHVFVSLLLFVR